jgi:hypothetical protein
MHPVVCGRASLAVLIGLPSSWRLFELVVPLLGRLWNR